MTQGMERSPERWTYDVFLSFRGADVRKNFLSHLYSGFKRQGLNTFMDDVELERGGVISPQLLEAIETSNILVVVLSKNYASSAWCLDELVHIMKTHQSNASQLVFPIFFYADPSDIRRQKGSYAESFSKHESRFPPNKVKEWREALTKVANISGWDMRSRNEAECIENITRVIREKCGCRYLDVPSYAVGMRSRLDHLYTLLSIGSDEVRVIGIYGMGGIGKTTLAKMAFNELSHLFEGSSFLENFKERAKTPVEITHLQHQLLSDILRRDNIKLYGLDHEVKESFRSKSVLIVVDDVDDIHQLKPVVKDPRCFGRGSRIIITTRNEHLLDQLKVKGKYSLTEFDGDESLELFSWHAFRASQPPKEFLQLSERVVDYCAGLPLAVEVLGASLITRSISEWESMLELLKIIPDGNIQKKLQISFDALDRVHKDVFLDIACFFIGMDNDYVACMYPRIVLKVLMERCLITVSGDNIMMHDLLRDMGREIVRNIPSKNCGEHSRLWNPDDVIRVLRRKTGTNTVEGLSLKANNKVMDFDAEAFAKMQELRLLQLSKVNLHGSYEHLPKDIRWLSWHGFSSESFPTNLSLRSVVALDMQYSNLKRFWKAQVHPQPANLVKHLDLSHSAFLKETPDFSYFPNVEKLLLVNCKSLVLVHKSIGILHKKLLLLNLSSCIELDALPEEFYTLKSLETLLLSNCSKLERLDDALGELESLTTLVADSTALKEIPFSINQLKKLKTLSLTGSLSDDSQNTKPASLLLPISLSGLSSLHTLNLAVCNLSDDMIPKDIESLSLLRRLDLAGNNFCNLPTDFARLTNLHGLKFNDCPKLQSILSLPRSLIGFVGRNCISLQRIPDLSECTVLTKLDLSDCPNLVEIPGINKLKRLRIFSERCYHGISNTRIPNTTDKIMLKDWLQRNHNRIYLPEYDLPNWVNFQGEMHSFSFTLPQTHNSDPAVGFTMWTQFVCQVDDPELSIPRSITVKNLTTGATLIHNIVKDEPEKIIFPNDFRIEAGNHIEVNVCCDDYITIQKTGFAFTYNVRDSSNCIFGDIQIPPEKDEICYAGDMSSLRCLRPNFEKDPFQAVVHDMRVVGGVVSEIYAYSIFPDISGKMRMGLRKTNQPVVEESDDTPRRKMRLGLKKIFGAIGFLTLGVVLGKYGKPLRLIHRRPVDEKDVEKD